MPEYKSYELRGGARPVVVEPLVEPGEGTHFAPEGHAWNPVVVSEGGGGGNPNYVEKIEGTVANPFGDMTLTEYIGLVNQINMGYATATMTVDGRALDGGYVPAACHAIVSGGDRYLVVHYAQPSEYDGDQYLDATAALYSHAGAPEILMMTVKGQTTIVPTEYYSQLPTELVIVHHPLPEEDPDVHLPEEKPDVR